MRELISIVAASMVTGCASGMPPMLGGLKPPELAKTAPEVLLVPCAALPEARDGKLASLIENHIEVVHLYYDCAERHRSLVDVIRVSQGAGPRLPSHGTDDLDTGIRPVLNAAPKRPERRR